MTLPGIPVVFSVAVSHGRRADGVRLRLLEPEAVLHEKFLAVTRGLSADAANVQQ